MSTPVSVSRSDFEALVVEHDPQIRDHLVAALQKRGYGVRSCDSLAEGRAQYTHQAVVFTHANGDTAELQGFVDFVRQSAGTSQPYILAVGESDSPSNTSQNRLGLDAFVAVPMENGRLEAQLETMARQLQPTPTGATPPPAPKAPAVLDHLAPVLLDHLPLALAMFDREMRYLAANRPFTDAFGLDPHDLIGRSHYQIFPDLHPNWRQLFERALTGETGRIDEDFFQRADGTNDWVRWEVRPWRESDGAVGGLILTQEIITARKRDDRRRVFDRNLAVSLFESASLPMLLVRLDGKILRSSPAARSALGLQPTADGRMPFWEVYPEREQEELERERFLSLSPPPADGTLGDFAPQDILIPGNPPSRLHWSPAPHRNAAGETQAVLLVGSLLPLEPITLTNPTPAEPTAPESAPTAAPDLARHLPIGLIQLDREGTVTAANDAASALLGRPLDTGTPFEPWLAAGAPEPVLREPVLREWRDNVWRRQMTKTFSLASSEGLLKEIELRPRLLPDGQLLLLLSDVTESRREEDALRTSEAKYRGLFRELPTSIALADRTGALVEGNPALEKLSGYSRTDLRRLRLADLVTLESPFRGPGTQASPATLLSRDGSRHPVVVSQGALCNPAGEPVLQACFFLPSAPTPAAQPPVAAPAIPSPPVSTAPESSEASWRDLAFDHTRTAMIVTDLRGRIRAANRAAACFFGTEPPALEGTALYRLFRPHDPAGFSREVSTSLNNGKSWNCETPFHDIEGQSRGTCRAEITPVHAASTPGLLCVLQPVFATVPGPA
jgi:PAS domain S-box-containing protein